MPLKHDNLSNEEVKLDDPKRLNINHGRVLDINLGRALNISLGVKFKINPAVLFGTVGKPRPLPGNINPWYDRQEVLFFPDQEESHAILTNLVNQKGHKCVLSMRENPKSGSRRS
ncbi:MAG: hypothetical protein KAJ52_08475 [Sedimentisphaerales bacterium]|nr:hypothetical protein [Sedimentisphaerales bacterium]